MLVEGEFLIAQAGPPLALPLWLQSPAHTRPSHPALWMGQGPIPLLPSVLAVGSVVLSARSAVPLGAKAWGWANRCTARKAQRKSACVSEPGDAAGPEECQQGLWPGKDKALRLTPPPAQHAAVG